MAYVHIDLAEHSYDIGIVAQSWEEFGAWLGRQTFSKKALIVSDNRVGPLYGEQIKQLFLLQRFKVQLSFIPEGESSKNLQQAEVLYRQAIEAGLDRNSVIVALGGGVVGDLAGFVAATYLRGIPLIQIPTSLFAQVDSSVGGKVAVDHELGKNLIGAFYQPRHVYINLAVLKTLDSRQFTAGLAEVIKYGLLADTVLFDYLETHRTAILARQEDALAWLIRRCCEIKGSFVCDDETEQGSRMALNLGHTMGHAIEAESHFTYLHGEAIAVGMVGACYVSELLGLIDGTVTERVKKLLRAYGLPLTAPSFQINKLLSYMQRDKKSFNDQIHWILLTGLGQWTVTANPSQAIMLAALAKVTDGGRS